MSVLIRLCIIMLLCCLCPLGGQARLRSSEGERVPDVSILIRPWDQVKICHSPTTVSKEAVRKSDPEVVFVTTAGYFYLGKPMDLLVINGKVVVPADYLRRWRPLVAFDKDWHLLGFIDSPGEVWVWRGKARKEGMDWPRNLPPNVLAVDVHCPLPGADGDRPRQYFYRLGKNTRFRQTYGAEEDCRAVARKETKDPNVTVYFIDGGSSVIMDRLPVCLAIIRRPKPMMAARPVQRRRADPLSTLLAPMAAIQPATPETTFQLPGLRP